MGSTYSTQVTDEISAPIDLKNDGFPNKKSFAVFNAIQNLIAGKGTLDDLLQSIQTNPASLEKIADIDNITGPEERGIWGSLARTFIARNITPVQYAFLTGREDAFALLLVAGAKIDEPFFYQCTSMNPKPNEESKTTATLYELMYRRENDWSTNKCVVLSMLPLSTRHAFLIALLQRGDARALDFMTHKIKNSHKLKAAWLDDHIPGWRNDPNLLESYDFFDSDSAKFMCNWIPSIDHLKEQLGTFPANQKMKGQTIALSLEFSDMQDAIKQWVNPYVLFTEEASDYLLPRFKALCDLFDELHENSSVDLDDDTYQQIILQKTVNTYRHFDRNKKKENYLGEIRSRVNYSCHHLFSGEGNPTPRKLAITILSMLPGFLKISDHSVPHCEAVLELARDQTQTYAKVLKDSKLEEAANQMTHMLSTPENLTDEAVSSIIMKTVSSLKSVNFANAPYGMYGKSNDNKDQPPRDEHKEKQNSLSVGQ
ncbi:MAG: hypothetical protein SFW66_08795 [Gammaproteobacteria bacterium]|nr:hypothetical protein [Gammaproteobacteria bacterium]